MDRQILACFRALGGNLFPTNSGSLNDARRKTPLFKGYQDTPTPDDLLASYAAQGCGTGWVLPEGLFVLDVDAASPQRPQKVGLTSLQRLEADIGEPLMWIGAASPTGGRHYYMQSPYASNFAGKLANYPDIEIKKPRGYVLIPGSHHWQGGFYQFSPTVQVMGLSPSLIPHAPEALVKLLMVQREPTVSPGTATPLPIQAVYELLSLLSPSEFADNDSWLTLAMAVHSACLGSAEGKALFESWCYQDARYIGDHTVGVRWDSFRPDGGISGRTLIRLTKDQVLSSGDTERLQRLNHALTGAGDTISAEDVFDIEPTASLNTKIDPLNGEAVIAPLDRPNEPMSRATQKLTANDELEDMQGTINIMPGICRRYGIYVQNYKLVQVMLPRVQGNRPSPEVRVLPESSLRALCTGSIDYVKSMMTDKKNRAFEDVHVRMPESLVKMVGNAGRWPGSPELRSIITGPILVGSKQAITKPGYYEETGTLYVGTDLQIEMPPLTRESAVAAAERLLDIVCDFPFAKPSHKAAWLSGLLTLFARTSIPAAVPMFMVVATDKDSGKSLLVRISTLIAAGFHETNPMAGGDEAELEKRVIAAMLQGKTILVMDNEANGSDIGGAWLDQMLTSPCLTGRILGESTMVTLENKMTIFTTGNSLRISPKADTSRRIIVSYLDRPEDRLPHYKHGDADELMEMVQERRGQFATDVLTILLAYQKAGAPRFARSYSSYEDWDRHVRQPLLWLGLPDPIQGLNDSPLPMDAQKAAISSAIQAFAGLIEALGRPSASTSEVFAEYSKRQMTDGFGQQGRDPILTDIDTAIELMGLKTKTLTATTLQYKLRDIAGKWHDGRRIVSVGANVWRVERNR